MLGPPLYLGAGCLDVDRASQLPFVPRARLQASCQNLPVCACSKYFIKYHSLFTVPTGVVPFVLGYETCRSTYASATLPQGWKEKPHPPPHTRGRPQAHRRRHTRSRLARRRIQRAGGSVALGQGWTASKQPRVFFFVLSFQPTPNLSSNLRT